MGARVAAFVVTVIGWFGALFTGRLPVFAADFLTGYLRWLARVYAYLYLLTDVYPPFALDDADYPVRLIGYGALTIFQFVSWRAASLRRPPSRCAPR